MSKCRFFKLALFCLCFEAAPFFSAWAKEPAAEFVGQHSDFFSLFLADKSDITALYRYEPGVKSKSGSGEFDQQTYGGSFDLLRPFNADTFLRLGAIYEAREYSFSGNGWSRLGVSDETLQKIAIRPGFGNFFNKDLLLTGQATIGAYSDFSGGLESDDFKFYGQSMLVYRLNPGAQLLVGVARSDAYEDYDILPLLGLRMMNEDGSLHISVTAPLEARFGIRPTPDVEFYAGYWAQGDEYQASMGRDEVTLKVREKRIGGGVLFWLGSHINFAVEGGAFLDSQFSYDSGRSSQLVPSSDLEPAAYVGVQLGIAL